MPPNPKWPVGSTVAGKFRVLRHLGQGGMGHVLEVEHQFTKYVGALKIINEEFASQPVIVQRFIREASAAGRIGSPHIVEMFDAGIAADGAPYLFMELLHGRSLEQWIATEGQLSVLDAIDVCLQAGKGLLAAHEAGIIHRDVKPANLFISPSGAGFRVKVLDFGISKFDLAESNPTLTVVGTTMGTLHYMPYEQLLSGNDVDNRADVYSLGVVLYECLTGVVPFAGETMVAQSLAIQRGDYVAVTRVRKDVPPLLDEVIAGCLVSERKRRIPDMETFAALLSQVRQELRGSLPTALSTPIPVKGEPPAQSPPKRPEARSEVSTEAAVASAIAPSAKPSAVVPALVGAAVALTVVGLAAYLWRGTGVPTVKTGDNASPTEVVRSVPVGPAGLESSPPAALSSGSAAVAPVVVERRRDVVNAPVVAPQPSGVVDKQRELCVRLLQRQSLGELLSDAEQLAFNRQCKK